MKERPILMNGAMVRATLNGSKTQTRRVVKMPHHMQIEERDDGTPWPWMYDDDRTDDYWMPCPYGQPGDRLWVREAWRTYASLDAIPPRDIAPGAGIQYEAGGSNVDGWNKLEGMGKYRPPMFMVRWASRILLEIVSVRVEHLQDISVADCCAEGAPLDKTHAVETWYEELWESINSPGSWDANPWVWVIEFKVVKAI